MSEIKVDTVAEKTSANGVTVDGLNIKDSKLVTANSVVTSNVTDANITSGKIANDAITLDKMASGTDGNIISYDASGNPVAIATGNDGQVLTSTGAGSPPAFETLPSGGKIGLIINSQVDYLHNTTGTTAIDLESSSGTTWETAITPSASNSKILVLGSVCIYNKQNGQSTNQETRFFLHFDQKIGSNSYSAVMNQNWMGHYYYNGAQKATLSPKWVSFSKLLTPNTTDEIKYKFQFAMHSSGGAVEVNGDGKKSSLTLIEVLA